MAAVDLSGRVAHATGSEILGTHAVATGGGCVAAGNLLATAGVPAAMIASFEAGGARHLAARLLAALEAGIAAGGEEGPTHSASLLVAHEHGWPLVDLRIDWTEDCPGKVLRGLWRAYEPQMQAYSLRALNPTAAPSYRVPGDE